MPVYFHGSWHCPGLLPLPPSPIATLLGITVQGGLGTFNTCLQMHHGRKCRFSSHVPHMVFSAESARELNTDESASSDLLSYTSDTSKRPQLDNFPASGLSHFQALHTLYRKMSQLRRKMSQLRLNLDDRESEHSTDSEENQRDDGTELEGRGVHGQAEAAQLDMREYILSSIAEDLKNNNKTDQLAVRYNNKLEKCPRDNEYPTLLHWIVHYMDFQSDEWKLKAAKEMLILVITLNPDLITQTNNLGETALHLAVGKQNPKKEKLGQLMCQCEENDQWRSSVKRAIATENKDGETCIHLAIVARLEIASTLIDISDDTPFSKKRIGRLEGKKVRVGGGNTPLHDAVAYKRCVFDFPECKKKLLNNKSCRKCQEKLRAAQKEMHRADQIIRSIVKKYDKALTLKNEDDDSPYMHFLKTKLAHTATQQSSTSQVQRHGLNRDYGASGNETPLEETRPGVLRAKSGPQSTMVLREKPEQYGDCPTKENTEVAEVVEKYLVESAFAVGDFNEACACFFGGKPGKSTYYVLIA